MIKLLISTLDFKHYTFPNLIPNVFKNELLLWRLFGLAITYCGIFYSFYMEIQFFNNLHSDKILDLYSKVFLAMFLPLFWIIGYTPFSMWYGLGYTFSTLLIILFSIITASYHLIIGVNFIYVYFSSIIFGFLLAYIIYNIMSPHWRKYY